MRSHLIDERVLYKRNHIFNALKVGSISLTMLPSNMFYESAALIAKYKTAQGAF